MIQATLFQLDDYGPWTTTPEPRREMDLQTLQSRLYAEIATSVGSCDGYAFYTRADNILAFTNGMDRAAHERLQRRVDNRYPVSLSAGVGTGSTPRSAVTDASERLQTAGSAQDDERTGVCRGQPLAESDPFHVAHFDVVDATERLTDQLDAFGVYRTIDRAYGVLADRLYEAHDALAFFVGGDNVVAVCPRLEADVYQRVCHRVEEETDVEWRVGVGAGEHAAVAGMAAKHALEEGRETGRTVVCDELVATTTC